MWQRGRNCKKKKIQKTNFRWNHTSVLIYLLENVKWSKEEIKAAIKTTKAGETKKMLTTHYMKKFKTKKNIFSCFGKK